MIKVTKVGISACTGFDFPEGTLTRMIGYKVLEDLRPDSTVLICLPALAAGVEEDIEFGEKFPTIVIEGCEKRCCTEIFKAKKLDHSVKCTYDISELIKTNPELKTDLSTLLSSKPQFSEKLQKFINDIAGKIAKDIDQLLQEGK